MPNPPTTYPNPRNDDPWDNDAVHWLLTHDDVAAAFDRHNLFECARRQARRVAEDTDRVIEAATLCERHGVRQVLVFDPKIGKEIYRLRRTDADAPEYPEYGQEVKRMTVTTDDRRAAEQLMPLLAAWEEELVSQGKSRSTVHTYVDRSERFLRRILKG